MKELCPRVWAGPRLSPLKWHQSVPKQGKLPKSSPGIVWSRNQDGLGSGRGEAAVWEQG